MGDNLAWCVCVHAWPYLREWDTAHYKDSEIRVCDEDLGQVGEASLSGQQHTQLPSSWVKSQENDWALQPDKTGTFNESLRWAGVKRTPLPAYCFPSRALLCVCVCVCFSCKDANQEDELVMTGLSSKILRNALKIWNPLLTCLSGSLFTLSNLISFIDYISVTELKPALAQITFETVRF